MCIWIEDDRLLGCYRVHHQGLASGPRRIAAGRRGSVRDGAKPRGQETREGALPGRSARLRRRRPLRQNSSDRRRSCHQDRLRGCLPYWNPYRRGGHPEPVWIGGCTAIVSRFFSSIRRRILLLVGSMPGNIHVEARLSTPLRACVTARSMVPFNRCPPPSCRLTTKPSALRRSVVTFGSWFIL